MTNIGECYYLEELNNMEIRKNWFTYIYLTIFCICLSYSLFSGILNIGVNSKYPFIWYGGIIMAMGGLWLLANTCGFMFSHIIKFRSVNSRLENVLETVFVVLILSAAAAARVWVIRNFPMQPESDFQTYFNVAKLLAQGTLIRDGVGYCDYISQFPHVFGYPYLLSKVFLIFGSSVTAGLYLNLAASLISIFLSYRIARLVCGKAGGLLALVLVAFWPSQILYVNQMASEAVFMCLTLISAWITAYLFKTSAKIKPARILLLYILAGIVLALAGGVRPVARILLIAIIICTLTYKAKAGSNEKSGLIKSCMSRGWIRVSVILISYLICSQLVSGSTARAIGRELPGTTVSFGYNMMVGLNIESKGAWNEKDAGFLNDRFMENGSAVEAHRASRDVAVQRIINDPRGMANLFFEKYTLLWENDDYASYWNSLFLESQHNLTSERKAFINKLTIWNNIYYIFCVYLSLISGVFLWFRKRVGLEHILILYFIGTAMLHMVLESQNRYHYSILPVFAILASTGLVEIFRYYIHKTKLKIESVIEKEELTSEGPISVEPEFSNSEEKIKDNRFDMLDAIKKGHITVTVTEAYIRQHENLNSDKKE
ncbi:MAG: hypothetical protein K0R50_507 [Eubacterium sp.]|nr:hypothetical protein [Eubacterium sp.]